MSSRQKMSCRAVRAKASPEALREAPLSRRGDLYGELKPPGLSKRRADVARKGERRSRGPSTSRAVRADAGTNAVSKGGLVRRRGDTVLAPLTPSTTRRRLVLPLLGGVCVDVSWGGECTVV